MTSTHRSTRLGLSPPLDEFLTKHLDGNGFELLSIERGHVVQVVNLPFHHRNPFDRLLVARSLTEAMPLLSADPAFDAYGVSRFW